jgi:hypothetical protein
LGSGNTIENNASIVLRLQYGEKVFLFMGDAEGKARTGSPNTPRYAEKVLLDKARKIKGQCIQDRASRKRWILSDPS